VEILYIMIPLGLVLVAFGLWAFFWATGTGQFDDLDSPGWTVLEDDQAPPQDASNAEDAPPPQDPPR
jgi:cbb3-type cytochrome oxidase maturation protein